MSKIISSTIKVRMGFHDAHYGGNLVDGARILQLFGDVATELLIRLDGDEGLFRAYESIEFLAPVYAGDFIEAIGTIIKIGKTSRKMEFKAYKVASLKSFEDSSAEYYKNPIEVCRAVGTCVTPLEKQHGELN